jgi:hypothetical protein
MNAADFWEKAFRGIMTALMAIGVSFASAIFKTQQDMQIKLAKIEATMPTKEDISVLNAKLFQHETRILTVELSCRKLTKSL